MISLCDNELAFRRSTIAADHYTQRRKFIRCALTYNVRYMINTVEMSTGEIYSIL